METESWNHEGQVWTSNRNAKAPNEKNIGRLGA